MHTLSGDTLPSLLKQIPDPPHCLYVEGAVDVLDAGPWLALVGTRKPSPYGLKAAHHFSRFLIDCGFGLVSGLARGIDAVAHSMSVLAHRPTIAVLAHGLDRIYPADHRSLAREIVESGGCLVTEFPPGTSPQPHFFPRRNRLISGLSLGTVVVEAGLRSGSLTTAKHAMNQNREVFIVPGPFDEEGFAGSHSLIQQGAKLVTQVQEVIEEMRPGVLPGIPVENWEGAPQAAGQLHAFLQTRGVATLEEIVLETGMASSLIAVALDWARTQGWAVELGPQCYVFAGGCVRDRRLPNASELRKMKLSSP